MVLQEKLKQLLRNKCSLQEFILQAERHGVHLLFNRASTGRVSGITYFYKGFKAKGQALGNRFKWMEILKHIYYEETRDGKAISEANSRTLAKYGEIGLPGQTNITGNRNRDTELSGGHTKDIELDGSEQGIATEAGQTDDRGRAQALQRDIVHDHISADANDHHSHRSDGAIDIQISDDIDDEAVHGRNRHRKKQARTNGR